jgi:hypothetical protein
MAIPRAQGTAAAPAAPTDPQGELSVVTSALRKTAKIWDSEGASIGSVGPSCKGMEMGGIMAGVFQGIVGPYDTVCRVVADRCEEAEQSMRNIATALNDNAVEYESAEGDNVALMMQLR